jgi:hypothetical protein
VIHYINETSPVGADEMFLNNYLDKQVNAKYNLDAGQIEEESY